MKSEFIIFSIILCFGFITNQMEVKGQAGPYFLPLFRDHYPTTTTTPTPISTRFPTTMIYDEKLKILKKCWRIKKKLLFCQIISREV